MGNIDTRYSSRNSGGNYTSLILIVLLVLFVGVAMFTKPDRLSVENKIVDKIMLSEPNLIKLFKNLFFGEEMNERYAQNLIMNTLKKNGHKNIGIYEEDYVILRKIEFRNEDSGESLITGYGMFDYTKVVLDYTKRNLNESDTSTDKDNLSYGKPNYKGKSNKSQKHYEDTTFDYETLNSKYGQKVQTETEEPKKEKSLLRKNEHSYDSYDNKKKNKTKEDSIKI